MDAGFKVEFDDPRVHCEPITDLGKKHSAQAFALSKDEVYHNPPYKARCPPPDKYKEKWEVKEGVLVIDDKKFVSSSNFYKDQ